MVELHTRTHMYLHIHTTHTHSTQILLPPPHTHTYSQLYEKKRELIESAHRAQLDAMVKKTHKSLVYFQFSELTRQNVFLVSIGWLVVCPLSTRVLKNTRTPKNSTWLSDTTICGKIWAITILIRVRGKVRGWVQFCTCLMGNTLH